MAIAEHLHEGIWQGLEDAARSPGNGFTLLNLATTGLDGVPKARSVILREFARSPERIGIATHAQADKVAEIQANAAVAVTFYDRERSVQLRVEGLASVVEDDAHRWRAWQQLAPHSKQQYVSRLTPGAPLAAHEEADDDPSTAFQRFAWISVELQRLDWLDLSADPHQRWQFERTAQEWRGQRVVA